MNRNSQQDDAKCRPVEPQALMQGEKSQRPPPRRFSLNSLRGIRREMAQVYRLARIGDLELSDACKYGYLLTTLAKLSESELLEARLARLEEQLSEEE